MAGPPHPGNTMGEPAACPHMPPPCSPPAVSTMEETSETSFTHQESQKVPPHKMWDVNPKHRRGLAPGLPPSHSLGLASATVKDTSPMLGTCLTASLITRGCLWVLAGHSATGAQVGCKQSQALNTGIPQGLLEWASEPASQGLSSHRASPGPPDTPHICLLTNHGPQTHTTALKPLWEQSERALL